MLALNKLALESKSDWATANIILPQFNIDQVTQATSKNPIWVHFGAGNIFRGFMANLQQQLLDQGLANHGIIAVESFDHDIIEKIYKPHDNLSLLVSLNPDGQTKKKIIASVTESLNIADANSSRLKEIFRSSSLQMVSFTITEKGYALVGADGRFLDTIIQDMQNGPTQATHIMSIVTALLYERYKNGLQPIAMVSMDNCSQNGQKLHHSIHTIAQGWVQANLIDDKFLDYINTPEKVSFPWSMVDKITPRPDESIQASLLRDGLSDMQILVTSKNTFIAPFVNAEIPEYLVIEDTFPNGRPALDKVGVYFTDRATVNKTECMKVTTCLNPLHTALAVFGCLLGYKRISDEMQDPDLKLLVERIGYQEGMPVVTNPKIIDPTAFIEEVLTQRFSNPFIPDTPQRIATDTSQKIPVRFGETLKSYVESDSLDIHKLEYIPLVIAAWFRYLLAFDDNLNKIECSPDPLLAELQSKLQTIEVNNTKSYRGELKKILSNKNIFAVDLVELGLAERIELMFCEMLSGHHAVRKALKKSLKI